MSYAADSLLPNARVFFPARITSASFRGAAVSFAGTRPIPDFQTPMPD